MAVTSLALALTSLALAVTSLALAVTSVGGASVQVSTREGALQTCGFESGARVVGDADSCITHHHFHFSALSPLTPRHIRVGR